MSAKKDFVSSQPESKSAPRDYQEVPLSKLELEEEQRWHDFDIALARHVDEENRRILNELPEDVRDKSRKKIMNELQKEFADAAGGAEWDPDITFDHFLERTRLDKPALAEFSEDSKSEKFDVTVHEALQFDDQIRKLLESQDDVGEIKNGKRVIKDLKELGRKNDSSVKEIEKLKKDFKDAAGFEWSENLFADDIEQRILEHKTILKSEIDTEQYRQRAEEIDKQLKERGIKADIESPEPAQEVAKAATTEIKTAAAAAPNEVRSEAEDLAHGAAEQIQQVVSGEEGKAGTDTAEAPDEDIAHGLDIDGYRAALYEQINETVRDFISNDFLFPREVKDEVEKKAKKKVRREYLKNIKLTKAGLDIKKQELGEYVRAQIADISQQFAQPILGKNIDRIVSKVAKDKGISLNKDKKSLLRRSLEANINEHHYKSDSIYESLQKLEQDTEEYVQQLADKKEDKSKTTKAESKAVFKSEKDVRKHFIETIKNELTKYQKEQFDMPVGLENKIFQGAKNYAEHMFVKPQGKRNYAPEKIEQYTQELREKIQEEIEKYAKPIEKHTKNILIGQLPDILEKAQQDIDVELDDDQKTEIVKTAGLEINRGRFTTDVDSTQASIEALTQAVTLAVENYIQKNGEDVTEKKDQKPVAVEQTEADESAEDELRQSIFDALRDIEQYYDRFMEVQRSCTKEDFPANTKYREVLEVELEEQIKKFDELVALVEKHGYIENIPDQEKNRILEELAVADGRCAFLQAKHILFDPEKIFNEQAGASATQPDSEPVEKTQDEIIADNNYSYAINELDRLIGEYINPEYKDIEQAAAQVIALQDEIEPVMREKIQKAKALPESERGMQIFFEEWVQESEAKIKALAEKLDAEFSSGSTTEVQEPAVEPTENLEETLSPEIQEGLEKLRGYKKYEEATPKLTAADFTQGKTAAELLAQNQAALDALYADMQEKIDFRESWGNISRSVTYPWAEKLARLDAERAFLENFDPEAIVHEGEQAATQPAAVEGEKVEKPETKEQFKEFLYAALEDEIAKLPEQDMYDDARAEVVRGKVKQKLIVKLVNTFNDSKKPSQRYLDRQRELVGLEVQKVLESAVAKSPSVLFYAYAMDLYRQMSETAGVQLPEKVLENIKGNLRKIVDQNSNFPESEEAAEDLLADWLDTIHERLEQHKKAKRTAETGEAKPEKIEISNNELHAMFNKAWQRGMDAARAAAEGNFEMPHQHQLKLRRDAEARQAVVRLTAQLDSQDLQTLHTDRKFSIHESLLAAEEERMFAEGYSFAREFNTDLPEIPPEDDGAQFVAREEKGGEGVDVEETVEKNAEEVQDAQSELQEYNEKMFELLHDLCDDLEKKYTDWVHLLPDDYRDSLSEKLLQWLENEYTDTPKDATERRTRLKEAGEFIKSAFQDEMANSESLYKYLGDIAFKEFKRLLKEQSVTIASETTEMIRDRVNDLIQFIVKNTKDKSDEKDIAAQEENIKNAVRVIFENAVATEGLTKEDVDILADETFGPEGERESGEDEVFQPGQSVRVKRSSGKFEDDWYVVTIVPGKGLVLVGKDLDDDRHLSKSVSIDDLREWQQEEVEPSSEEVEKPSAKIEFKDKLLNIALDPQAIEKLLTPGEAYAGTDEKVDTLAGIKEILSQRERGKNSESLKALILQVIEQHVQKYLTPEQIQEIHTQLDELAEKVSIQIIVQYDAALEQKAKEQIGFFDKLVKRFGKGALKNIAITTGIGLSAAALSFVMPAGLVAGAAFGARFGISILQGKKKKPSLPEEEQRLEEKYSKKLIKQRKKILKSGYQVGYEKNSGHRVAFLDPKVLALDIRNAVRLNTTESFRTENVIDSEGNLKADAATTLKQNIIEALTQNPLERARMTAEARQVVAEQGGDYDGLTPEEQIDILNHITAQEAAMLYFKYAQELRDERSYGYDFGDKKYQKHGSLLRKVSAFLTGNVSEFRANNTQHHTNLDHVLNAAASSAVGLVVMEATKAYSDTSLMYSTVAGGAAGARFGYETGRRAAEFDLVRSYENRCQFLLTKAERNIRKIQNGDQPEEDFIRTMDELQSYVYATKPRTSSNDAIQPLLSDSRLRNAAIEMLEQYRERQAEQVENAQEKTTDQILATLQQGITASQQDLEQDIKKRMRNTVAGSNNNVKLYTIFGAASGVLMGAATRMGSAYVMDSFVGGKSSETDSTDGMTRASGGNEQARLAPSADPTEDKSSFSLRDLLKTSIFDLDTTESAGNDTTTAESDATAVPDTSQNTPDQQPPPAEHFTPEVKNNIWNTLEHNIKTHPAYHDLVERATGLDLDSMTPEQINQLDLDKYGLGTTLIDGPENNLIASLQKGETTYLRGDLSADDIHRLGFDRPESLDVHNLTQEQREAIDWEKAILGEDGRSTVAEAGQAMQANIGKESDIEQHNEALAELESKGKLDWHADADKAADQYQSWKESHPDGTLDQYLQSQQQTPTESTPTEKLEQIVPVENNELLQTVQEYVQTQGAADHVVVEKVLTDPANGNLIGFSGKIDGVPMQYSFYGEYTLPDIQDAAAQVLELQQILGKDHNLGFDFSDGRIGFDGSLENVMVNVGDVEDVAEIRFDNDMNVEAVKVNDTATAQGISDEYISLLRKLEGKSVDQSGHIIAALEKEHAHVVANLDNASPAEAAPEPESQPESTTEPQAESEKPEQPQEPAAEAGVEVWRKQKVDYPYFDLREEFVVPEQYTQQDLQYFEKYMYDMKVLSSTVDNYELTQIDDVNPETAEQIEKLKKAIQEQANRVYDGFKNGTIKDMSQAPASFKGYQSWFESIQEGIFNK